MMRRVALVLACAAIVGASLAPLAASADGLASSYPDPSGNYAYCSVAVQPTANAGTGGAQYWGGNVRCNTTPNSPAYLWFVMHFTTVHYDNGGGTLGTQTGFDTAGQLKQMNTVQGINWDISSSTLPAGEYAYSTGYASAGVTGGKSWFGSATAGDLSPSNLSFRVCTTSQLTTCVPAQGTISTSSTFANADGTNFVQGAWPYGYFPGGTGGGTAGAPPAPPPDCAVTNVAANWPSTGPQMSTQYQLAITYTGTATQLSILWGDKRAPTVMNPAPASVATVAVYWDQVGSYSAEVDCTGTSGAVSKWAIPVNVVQTSKTLTACLPDSIGSVLDPSAWVKSMGCVMEWAFIPSDQTKAQFAAVWGNVQTKAPFSFVYDVATFLPNSANQFASGIHDADAPNVIGDRSCATFIEPAPLSGTPGIGSGPRVDGCIDSQLTHNGLSPWAATVRSIILFLVLITLALGIWRMTTKAIG